jgi:hypothetical protein
VPATGAVLAGGDRGLRDHRSSSRASYLAGLRRICQSRDLGELVITLKDAIPDYSPSSELLHRLIGARRVMVAGRG